MGAPGASPPKTAVSGPGQSVPLRGYARELVPALAAQGVSVMSIVGNNDQVMPIITLTK